MSDEHAHDPHCGHDHGDHDHHHDNEPKRAPRPKLSGFGERWAEFKKNVDSRFNKGIDPTHVIEHGDHTHPAPFTASYKRGAILGASLSVGAIIHGGVNVSRGISGYEDSLGEEHKPSVRRLLVGASEIIGGAMALSRTLSGRWLP